MRNHLFTSILAALLLTTTLGTTAQADCPSSAGSLKLDPISQYGTDILEFDIYRKGNLIGRHVTKFENGGNALKVTHDMQLAIKFLFVTAYRLTYEASEVWCGNELFGLTAAVDRNGDPATLNAERKGNEIQVDSSRKGTFSLARGTFPSNHWNNGVLSSNKILNTLTGGPNKVDIENLGQETIIAEGKEISATRHRYSGELEADVWYDSEGRWVKLEFPAEDRASAEKDNSFIEYVCVRCGVGS